MDLSADHRRLRPPRSPARQEHCSSGRDRPATNRGAGRARGTRDPRADPAPPAATTSSRTSPTEPRTGRPRRSTAASKRCAATPSASATSINRRRRRASSPASRRSARRARRAPASPPRVDRSPRTGPGARSVGRRDQWPSALSSVREQAERARPFQRHPRGLEGEQDRDPVACGHPGVTGVEPPRPEFVPASVSPSSSGRTSTSTCRAERRRRRSRPFASNCRRRVSVTGADTTRTGRSS